MRRKATWLILTAVGVVVIAAAVDAVRRSSSGAESAGGNVITIDGLTMTAPSAQVTTEGAATTVGVTTTTEAVDTTAQVVELAPPERLPPCTQRQLKLAIRVGEDRAEFVLRRVMGQPCHLRRSRVRLRVLDQAGSEVVLSTSNFYWQRGTPPADFDHGFVMVTLDPYLAICDPRATFTAVASVGPYVARRTVAGSEIDCRGS
jgi:hypothetical protein